jgi:hypothetical protein
MITISIPRSPISSQRIELDNDGVEYTLEVRWVTRYQRFYLTILDSSGVEVSSALKLVSGAPINLGQVKDVGPKGIFVMSGQGAITRDCFDNRSYVLYYLDRSEIREFPLILEYLINSDISELIDNYGMVSAIPETKTFIFLSGNTFEFINGGNFEFIN